MAYNFSGLKILVIESSGEMFTLIRSALNAFGVQEVAHATDASTGIRKFRQLRPDIVITDWLQGSENGLWLTKEMRQSPDSADHFVPIIMMTGYSQKKRVISARDAGINEFVVKPFCARTLYKKIERIIEQPRKFVRTADFFGPDRRRHDDAYQGPERRTEDQTSTIPEERKTPGVTAREIRLRMAERLLADRREQNG